MGVHSAMSEVSLPVMVGVGCGPVCQVGLLVVFTLCELEVAHIGRNEVPSAATSSTSNAFLPRATWKRR